MLLLDLMLPGMTGEELLERIDRTDDMPVLIISAKNEPKTKVSVLRGGADDFITKPFDVEEVSARIDSHLRTYARIAQPVLPHVLQHKGLVLNRDAMSVTADGAELEAEKAEEEDIEPYRMKRRKLYQEKETQHRLTRISDALQHDDKRIDWIIDTVLNEIDCGRVDELLMLLQKGVEQR